MARRGAAARLEGLKRVQVRKPVPKAFTKRMWDPFFETLAGTANVTMAAKAAKISTQTAYRVRAKNAEFRARWATALAEGYAKLELMLLERAMNGTVKTVDKGNGAVDRTHEFPNAIALSLLRLHRESVGAAENDVPGEPIEEIRERVLGKLLKLQKRIDAGEQPLADVLEA